MSKKTHKMALMKEEEKNKRSNEREAVGTKRAANVKKPQPAAGKPAANKGAARSYDRPAAKTPPANLLLVRVIALVIAAAALAGGVYWIIQVQGNATFPVVLGLIGLGFVAGLGIFTAVRAEEVVKRARAAASQRR